jgi:hypothetical protein
MQDIKGANVLGSTESVSSRVCHCSGATVILVSYLLLCMANCASRWASKDSMGMQVVGWLPQHGNCKMPYCLFRCAADLQKVILPQQQRQTISGRGGVQVTVTAYRSVKGEVSLRVCVSSGAAGAQPPSYRVWALWCLAVMWHLDREQPGSPSWATLQQWVDASG